MNDTAVRAGILGFACYVPRLRMPREVIADQLSWANRSLLAQAKGTRSLGNWDEDAVTFAVAGARAARAGHDRARVDRLVFASTTFPFLDRSNAGLVAEAVGLKIDARTSDAGGSLRAATGALIESVRDAGAGETTLVTAADRRGSLPGSPEEMAYGDAGAAVLTGPGEGIARIVATASRHADFVDHYRTHERPNDYAYEERWVRDAALVPQVREALKSALAAAGMSPGDLDRLALPFSARHAARIAKTAGIEAAVLVDAAHATIGDTGAAHPLIVLCAALESAAPGERIAVVGFGQGCDVIVLETTDAIANYTSPAAVAAAIASGVEETNYLKLPVFSRRLSVDAGMRAEADKRTAMSTYWRKHDEINQMMGSKCNACGQMHYPRVRVCVHCAAVDDMSDVRFAEFEATVKTYTEDWLAATPNPPHVYGNVRFECGGNALLEFTDCEPGRIAIGTRMKMAFRIKDFDDARGFRRYFWKPVPVEGTTGEPT